MLISKKYRFIFIHIYKNAGSSITHALTPFSTTQGRMMLNRFFRRFGVKYFDHRPYPDHITARELTRQLSRKVFKSYFSFAFVRNPWDWQVSLYSYMRKNVDHHQHALSMQFGSFKEYIRWRCANEVVLQKSFICDKHDSIMVDYVGRFESINEDFQIICSKIGISANLRKINVSNTKSYKEYYCKETVELVSRAYKDDIDFFRYTFD